MSKAAEHVATCIGLCERVGRALIFVEMVERGLLREYFHHDIVAQFWQKVLESTGILLRRIEPEFPANWVTAKVGDAERHRGESLRLIQQGRERDTLVESMYLALNSITNLRWTLAEWHSALNSSDKGDLDSQGDANNKVPADLPDPERVIEHARERLLNLEGPFPANDPFTQDDEQCMRQRWAFFAVYLAIAYCDSPELNQLHSDLTMFTRRLLRWIEPGQAYSMVRSRLEVALSLPPDEYVKRARRPVLFAGAW